MQPQTLLQHYPRPSPPQTPKQSINYSSLHVQQLGANTSTNPSTVPTHHTASKHGLEAVSPGAIVRVVHVYLLCTRIYEFNIGISTSYVGRVADATYLGTADEEKRSKQRDRVTGRRYGCKGRLNREEMRNKTRHNTQPPTPSNPPSHQTQKNDKEAEDPPLQQPSPGISIRSEGSTST